MLATAHSQALLGLDGIAVEVEAHVSRGVPAFTVVGLPDRAVTEARERVRSGITAAELEFPLRRVTVSLAPGALPKLGSCHDLAIAVSVLAATGQVSEARARRVLCLGELALDGAPAPGAGRPARGRDRRGRPASRRCSARPSRRPRPPSRRRCRPTASATSPTRRAGCAASWRSRRPWRPPRGVASPSRTTSATCADSRSPGARSSSRPPGPTAC